MKYRIKNDDGLYFTEAGGDGAGMAWGKPGMPEGWVEVDRATVFGCDEAYARKSLLNEVYDCYVEAEVEDLKCQMVFYRTASWPEVVGFVKNGGCARYDGWASGLFIYIKELHPYMLPAKPVSDFEFRATQTVPHFKGDVGYFPPLIQHGLGGMNPLMDGFIIHSGASIGWNLYRVEEKA